MNEIAIKNQTPLPLATNDEIRHAQTKVIERLSADPVAARVTISAAGHVGDGLACTVKQGKFTTTMDMGPAMGGAAFGPSPGFFARAAIIGCVAIAIKMTAAREGLKVQSVDVDLETDSDDLAIFGLGGGNAAPLETRISIMVNASEPDGIIADLIERVLKYDPWFLALRDAQTVLVDARFTR